MKLDKKTEKALLMGAALLFVLLLCIAIALMISPEEEEAEPTPAVSVPTATAKPSVKDGVSIGGKLTDPHTDTFYLHKTILSDGDMAAIAALSELRTLSLTDCTLTNVAFLSSLTNLTTLYLSDNYIADLSPLSSMQSLRTLYLDGNPVGDLAPLFSLSSLQTLSLQSVPLSTAQLDALKIALPGCKIFDDAASGSARPLMLGGMSFTAEDTELYLSSRGISDISVLSQCPKLIVLDLSGNPLEGVGVLKQLSSLRTLNLAYTNLTDSELRIVMGIRSLRWLNVSGNDALSGEVIDELLTTLSGCEIIHDEPRYKIKLGTETLQSDITELTMPSARLGSIGPLRKCTKLITVDLSHNYLSDLSPLALDLDIISLLLEDNRIQSCEGLYFLAKLENLDLSENQLGDISALTGCMSLTRLDLSNNALTYLTPLYSCINLRWLDLRGNPLSWETVEALRAALPFCEIVSDAEAPVTPEPTPLPTPEPTPEPLPEPLPLPTEIPVEDPVIFPDEPVPTPPPEEAEYIPVM